MPIKKIIIISLIISTIIVGIILISKNPSAKKETEEIPEKGKIIYSKTFKNGLDPKKSLKEYKATLQEVQSLLNLPLKYPLETLENYKLFKIVVFQKEKGIEEVEIYFDKDYQSLLEESTKYFPEKKDYSGHGYVGFNEKKSTILLRETIIQPEFYYKNFYIPKDQIKEITLINKKRTILLKYNAIDESSGNIKFSNTLYLGYSQKNQKKYYYLVESNIEEEKIISFANLIIKDEKNE